jgi:hypothetical protein
MLGRSWPTLRPGDPAAYAAAFPECDIDSADVNGDGQINDFDIDAFVALLGG